MIIRLSLLILAIALALPAMPAVGDDSDDRIQVAQRPGGRPGGAGGGMRESAQKRMSDENYADMLGRPGNGPAYGTVAPDFELMPLKFYEFGIDETEITQETAHLLYEPVRLSDFRGVKPVVLIFGSYT